MGIEAVKSAGAAYQAASTPEVVKEISQPKNQVIDIQTGAAALAAETVEISPKSTGEQQGSNQDTQSRANAENIKKAVEQINKRSMNSEAVFGIHEKTNRVTIKIIDKTTKEVIKEFPPEKTLDMIAKAWELAGIMVDEKR